MKPLPKFDTRRRRVCQGGARWFDGDDVVTGMTNLLRPVSQYSDTGFRIYLEF